MIVFVVIQYVVNIVVFVDYKILFVKEAFEACRMVLIVKKADYNMMVRVVFGDVMIVVVGYIFVVGVFVRNNNDSVFLIVPHRKHHL